MQLFQEKIVLDAHGRDLAVVQFLLCSHYRATPPPQVSSCNHLTLKEAAHGLFPIFHLDHVD